MNGVNRPPSSGCFLACVEKPIGDQGQGVDALAVAVLDHEFEAAGLAQAADRRRLEHDGDRAANFLGDRGLKLPGQGRCPKLGRRALAPFLQGHERRRRVGLIGGVQDVEALEQHDVADAFDLQGDLADGGRDLRGRFAARAVGRLDRGDQVALVLDRNERLGPLDQHGVRERQQRDRRHDDRPPVMGGEFEERVVRILEPVHARVEPAEQEELGLAVLAPQEHARHRRAERERVDRGEDEREDDRHGELVVQPAGQARG